MRLKTITNRVFFFSSGIAVAVTLFCLAVINHFDYQQRLLDQKGKLESLLDQQVPYLKNEFINSRFYAIRLRGQDLATRYEASDVRISLYDATGNTIFESASAKEGDRAITPMDLVQASRSLVFAGETLGAVKLSAHVLPNSSGALGHVLLLTLGILLCSFLVLFLACHHLLKNHVLDPLQRIAEAVPEIRRFIDRRSDILTLPVMPKSTELASVVRELSSMSHELRDNLAKTRAIELAMERQTAITELARQVAHDIRSPLAALEMFSSHLETLPEAQRVILRQATGRIRDIANNLLDRKIQGTNMETPPVQPFSTELLSMLVSGLISEKREQYRNFPGVEIEIVPSADDYGLFVHVQPVEFARVLSNLINNAVESMNTFGRVNVQLKGGDEGSVLIEIGDTGKGIPAEILPKLMQRGETHGKPGGSGLGLAHARECMESWGGSIQLRSQLGVGTRAILRLPRASTPSWFTERLEVSQSMPLVVVDDDPSIHEIWNQRLGEGYGENSPQLVHVYSAQALRDWILLHGDQATRALYLMDYDLGFEGDSLGQERYSISGLDLLLELGLGQQGILVTSRADEPELRQRCEQKRVRMIPKGMASFVPITILAVRELWDALLIDDDPLVRMTWNLDAKKQGLKFQAFPDSRSFFKVVESIDTATPIYVDVHLGEGRNGIETVRDLQVRGFGRIYFATGYKAQAISELPPGLSGILGKEPPWSVREA